MIDKIHDAREYIKNQKPIIHCITNPISINGCANAILSFGAKPIMAATKSKSSLFIVFSFVRLFVIKNLKIKSLLVTKIQKKRRIYYVNPPFFIKFSC